MPFNQRSSYTNIDNISTSPSSNNRRYSSIPSSTYFTDTSNNKNPFKNNSIDISSSGYSNDDHFFSLNEPPPTFNWKRRSSILQAETLKNSFNELDYHQNEQSSLSPLSPIPPPSTSSPSKNPFLTDIEIGIHPLASSDIKDNNYLSPPPINIMQRNNNNNNKNNQQTVYFRRASIYEKREKENEQQEENKKDDIYNNNNSNNNNNNNNLVYNTTPFLEPPMVTKDLHITLPDVKRNYFDMFKTKEEKEKLGNLKLPYPFRKKEPINQRLERINQSIDKNKQKQPQQQQKQSQQQQNQPYLRHSVDNSDIDRLSSIDINGVDPDKNDKMVDSNSLITSWLDTSVNL